MMLFWLFSFAFAGFPAEITGSWALDGPRSDNAYQKLRSFARAIEPSAGGSRFSPDQGSDSVQDLSQKAWTQLLWLVNQTSEAKFEASEEQLLITFPAETENSVSKKWTKVKLPEKTYKIRAFPENGQVVIERKANGNRVIEYWLPKSEDGTRAVVVMVGSSILQNTVEFRRVYRPLK